ncbi:alpha/beta hydrolase family protein [Stutzerimonas zhaodongensis]|uniref:alpha/beta hydrolase family protein n=1 Tax=Stutzerimonas zhaodongensis TaxID=1176257 RepID=UPI002106110E|nr:dienelactone hydrolase family protein [Stutzerimonas zhaodongensis]
MKLKVYLARITSLVTVSLLASSLAYAAPGPSAPCADCSRGPNPTVASLQSRSGPFTVSTFSVSGYLRGFGNSTVHYPTNATGKMGAIAVIPGYLSYEDSIRWWGPRLASHGFVVITMNTNTIYDQPDSRATQLSRALDYVIEQSNSRSSPISGKVDSTRLGAIGWSMGGGGSLKLSTERSLNAIIPQAPYYAGLNRFNTINTPTMILACSADVVAPVASHASPFYNRIPDATPKAFLEIYGGSHFCANSGYPNEDLLGMYGISWMKRFIDFDSRYSQFLCGPNHAADLRVSEYRENCNY